MTFKDERAEHLRRVAGELPLKGFEELGVAKNLSFECEASGEADFRWDAETPH